MEAAKTSNRPERRTITKEQWEAEGTERFGPNMMDWAFRCPACRHEATISDWKKAGANEGAVGFNCIGRYVDGVGCDHTLGGLFSLQTTDVIDGGVIRPVFEFAGDGDRTPHNHEALEQLLNAAAPMPPADAPESWNDFPWDDWVPAEVRRQIIEFWSCFGRSPRNYLEDCIERRGPAYGQRFRAQAWGTKEWHEGRWIHCWNNIGRLVKDDGSYICSSHGGVSAVDADTEPTEGAA